MNSTSEDSASTYGPVDPGRRIEAVDIVRGFALFDVMLVNMFNFGADSLIWTAAIDQSAFSIMQFFGVAQPHIHASPTVSSTRVTWALQLSYKNQVATDNEEMTLSCTA